MSLSKVIKTAELELGVTEWPRGSNLVKYNTDYYGMPVYGSDYKWCVTFLWWVFQQAGESTAFFNGGKTASCTRLMELYKAEGKWYTDGNYQEGDIAIMSFMKSRAVQHCGLIIGRSKDGGWITAEGNTSPGLEGSQENGGSVAKKIRYNANILGCCRPQYKEEEPVPKDDVTGHWAQQSIQWAKENIIMNGYPDGSFRPNDPVLRGEEATITYRLYELFTKELVELRKEIARLREEIRQIRGEDDRK